MKRTHSQTQSLVNTVISSLADVVDPAGDLGVQDKGVSSDGSISKVEELISIAKDEAAS